MPLPKFAITTATVEVDGQTIPVHGIPRSVIHEMTRASTAGDDGLAEAILLAAGCDVTIEEAKEWLAEVPMHVSEAVLDKIMETSGGDGGKASNGG